MKIKKIIMKLIQIVSFKKKEMIMKIIMRMRMKMRMKKRMKMKMKLMKIKFLKFPKNLR